MGRSAVSNGRSVFLPDSASTLRKVRRYRDILAEMVDDLGGMGVLSEAQRQMCRRAVTMAMQCEAWDAAAAASETVDWDLYSRVSGHLRRIFETLGLERKPRPDVAPSLYEIAQDIRAGKVIEARRKVIDGLNGSPKTGEGASSAFPDHTAAE